MARYFKGNLPQSSNAKIYETITGHPNTQSIYGNGNKAVVKLKLDGDDQHPSLNSFTEISQADAQALTEDTNQL